MSREEMRVYGKQEFGTYPLISMEPRPETIQDYYKSALRGETGSRKKNLNKHLICGKTAKTYVFWDNLMYHYKNLAPLYGKKIEFKEYISPHDGWLFSFPQNLKLHHKISQFERTEATHIEHRVNLDNPSWIPPCERNMERYTVKEQVETTNIKKSRFLKKEVKTSIKPQEKEEEKEEKEQTKKKEIRPMEKIYYKKTDKYDWPHDPDMLEPMPAPKQKNIPKYYGWTHSEDADSWYLEAQTPSLHDPYADFYADALNKKVICPKLYSLAC
jgi:hypothetical protein